MKRIEKTCKQCQVIFFVEYEPKGSGTGNVARIKYCSKNCKKLFSKNNANLFERVKKSCSVCSKSFFAFPSQAMNRATCSKACCREHMKKINKKYEVITKTCLVCPSTFLCNENNDRKYCSQMCSKKATDRKKSIECEVCGVVFLAKASKFPRFCNKICSRKAQSLGLIKSHTNGRSGWRSDIVNSPYFKSSFEADYARYCNFNLIIFEYEKKVFSVGLGEKTRYYTPDFYLPELDEYVELKGVRESENSFSKMLNSNSQARETLRDLGVNIKVIYMNDFYEMLKTTGLWEKITNLENKNYAKTVHLIRTHKDQQD